MGHKATSDEYATSKKWCVTSLPELTGRTSKAIFFVHTIIIFGLTYYTNITITVTFVNQMTLCCAFLFFSPQNYPHKSGAIFHIHLYVFNIHTEIPNGTNKLNHMKRSAIFLNEPFGNPYGRMNHLCCHWNKCMLPLVKTFFTTVVHDGFLSSMKGSSSTNWLLFPTFFLDLVWQTMLPSPTAAFQQETMVLCMKVVPLVSSSLSKSMKHSSHGSSNCVKNANTGNHTLISWTMLIGFLYFRETTR